MATADEYLAAAAKAEAAGDTEAAAKLRAYAGSVAPQGSSYLDAAKKAEAAGDTDAAAKLRAFAASQTPAEAPAPKQEAQKPADQYVDWGQAPMGASESDPLVGQDELGQNIYRSPYGVKYSRPMVTVVPKTKSIADASAGDWIDAGRNLVGGIVGAIGQGITAPGRALAGEPVTANDVMATASLVAPDAMPASPRQAAASVAAEAAPPARPANVGSIPQTVVQATDYTPDQIGALVSKATGRGMGAVRAQEELAAAARVNPAAKAAADRLGIDLPADVFAENPQVKAAAGLTRSQAGSEAEAAWRNAVSSARTKADEAIAAIDGSPDLASVSDKVKTTLQGAQAGLKTQAKALYDQVDAAVPKGSAVPVDNTVKALNQTIADLGGTAGMSPAEKQLFALVTDPNQQVTYGRLIREKSLIGKAIDRGDSPYSSLDQATLKRMYAALAEDQLDAVAALGDDTLRAKLREANQLTAKQKALEKRIVNSFGGDLDGSIGNKLRAAITQGAKGDIAGLARVLKVIPSDLHREAVASALSAITRSARAAEGGFGLPEFAKVFSGIKANRPVYNLIGKTLGPDGMAMLNDLHEVATRIVQADANVLRTGKANQALVGALTADGIVGKVIDSSLAQRAGRAAGAAVGMATGGTAGAIAGSEGVGMLLTRTKPDVLAAAGRLFSSDDFMRLATEGATPEVLASLNRSPSFLTWAKKAGVDAAQWLGDLAKAGAKEAAAPAAVSAAQSNPPANTDKPWLALRGKY